MSVSRASSSDDTAKKLSLRTLWKIGEKFPVNFVPSVEGMVVSTKWKDGVFSVVFISPPFRRQGGSWAEAAVVYRTTSSFERKPLPKYDYPFPDDTRILQEAIKANGNLEVLQEIVKFLNRAYPEIRSEEQFKQQSSSAWEREEDSVEEPLSGKDEEQKFQVPPQHPQILNETMEVNETFSAVFMDKLAAEVSKRLSLPHGPQSLADSVSYQSLALRKRKKEKSSKNKDKREETSSTSSHSSSDSSSSSSDVGNNEKKGSGLFNSPFSKSDTRQVADPKNTMKGKFEERKILRKALQNLYSEFTTLKWYVDSLKVECSTASFKPFPADILWLSQHALYLDQMLLHSLRGPWKLWNELSLDHMTRAFLELLVRVSPIRAYPEFLDEKVRKWMRKKRVGLSAQYGPIPLFLADAKISDAGVQPKGGWTPFPKRDNKFIPSSTNKTKGSNSTTFEKKPPI